MERRSSRFDVCGLRDGSYCGYFRGSSERVDSLAFFDFEGGTDVVSIVEGSRRGKTIFVSTKSLAAQGPGYSTIVPLEEGTARR